MRLFALVLFLALAGCAAPAPAPEAPAALPAASSNETFAPAPRPPLDLAACREARWKDVADWECLGVANLSRAPLPFATHDWIDLDGIARVSKFRSGAGHDYGDAAESCRSLKHYFAPKREAAPALYAPADGTVFYVREERAAYGRQVGIAPDAPAGVFFVLFHAEIETALVPGARVSAGDRIGAVVPGHGTDVAIIAATPEGLRAISYFDAVTDEVFERYRARGATVREDFIISKAWRDANPLTCDGERFASAEHRDEDWVLLS